MARSCGTLKCKLHVKRSTGDYVIRSMGSLEPWRKSTCSEEKQVHSLCVDSRPGDRSFFAKGPPSSSLIPHHCVKHSLKLTARLSAMAVRKTVNCQICTGYYTLAVLDSLCFQPSLLDVLEKPRGVQLDFLTQVIHMLDPLIEPNKKSTKPKNTIVAVGHNSM